jgi:hypothetical protein
MNATARSLPPKRGRLQRRPKGTAGGAIARPQSGWYVPSMRPGALHFDSIFAPLVHATLAICALVLTSSTAGASEIHDGDQLSYALAPGVRTCVLFPEAQFDPADCPGLQPVRDVPGGPGAPQRQVALARVFFEDRGAPAVAKLSITFIENPPYELRGDYILQFANEMADGIVASWPEARLRTKPPRTGTVTLNDLPIVRISFDVDGLSDERRLMEHVILYAASSSRGLYTILLTTTSEHAAALDVIGDESAPNIVIARPAKPSSGTDRATVSGTSVDASASSPIGVHIPDGFVDLTHGVPEQWAGQLPPYVEQLANSGTKLAYAVDITDAGLVADFVASEYAGRIPDPSAIGAAEDAATAELAKPYPPGTKVETVSARAATVGTVQGTRIVLSVLQPTGPIRTLAYLFPVGDHIVSLAFSTPEANFASYEPRFDAAALKTTGLGAPASAARSDLFTVIVAVANGILVIGALALFAARKKKPGARS